MLRHVTAPDGVQIACEVSGRGPTLVLVHGAGSARWSFDLLRPLLEPRFTVVAVDRRGRGDSGDGRSYRLESEFEDVAAVVGSVRDEAEGPVHLFGHSYGGLVAGGAAPLAEGLGKLVLYEPPMGGILGTPAQLAGWRELAEADERDRFVAEFLRHVGGYTPRRSTPCARHRPGRAASPSCRPFPGSWTPSRPTGSTVRRSPGSARPRCCWWAAASPAWAVRSTEAYAEALTGASVARLEGQGHGALAAAPELVASELEPGRARAGQGD